MWSWRSLHSAQSQMMNFCWGYAKKIQNWISLGVTNLQVAVMFTLCLPQRVNGEHLWLWMSFEVITFTTVGWKYISFYQSYIRYMAFTVVHSSWMWLVFIDMHSRLKGKCHCNMHINSYTFTQVIKFNITWNICTQNMKKY